MASVSFDKTRKKWKVYWISTVNGQSRRGSKSFDAKGLAVAYCKEVESSIGVLKSQPRNAVSINEVIPVWVLHCRRFTDRTQDLYARSIDGFLDVAQKHSIQELSVRDLSQYVERMTTSGVTNRTVNSRLTAVRSFIRWLSVQYKIPNITQGFPALPEDPANRRVLSETEVELVLKKGTALFRQRALFLLNTGLRATELCNLSYRKPEKPKAVSAWVMDGGKMLEVFGKGRKLRYIPLNETCCGIIKTLGCQCDYTGYIFMSKSGTRLRRCALYHQFAKLAGVLGIPAFGPHSLRHFFATQLLLRGVEISKVSRILGHSSIRTTEGVYVHWVPDHFIGVTDRLEVFNLSM